MPVDYVRKIIAPASVRQPKYAPDANAWSAVEKDLGTLLPADFKSIVSAVGDGSFGVGLTLRNPCSPSEYVRLSRETLPRHREMVATFDESSKPPLYPDKDGFIVIGEIDRQQFLVRTSGSNSAKYDLVWWDLDLERTRDLNISLSQFIHDLYQGSIDEDWAEELRAYFWRSQNVPFFTPHGEPRTYGTPFAGDS